ncbi:ABC transporter permease subunit, partial [Bacillus cereus]
TGFSIANVQIEESARDLGASEYQVFLHVTLPLAFPALLSGMILSFVRALGEFGATLMFAGNIPGKTQTIPTAIYMAIDASNMQLAWTLVVITIGMSLVFLLCIQLINKRITNS